MFLGVDPGLIIVAAVALLTTVAIYWEVRKARAQRRAHKERLEAAWQALDAFAASHQLEAGSSTDDEVKEYSYWATSAEDVRRRCPVAC